MPALHACYHPGTPDSLMILGEDPSFKAPKKRGRKPKNPSSIPHPCALSHEALKERLSSYHPLPDDLETRMITLRMPVQGGVPLLADKTPAGDGVSYQPVQFPALLIPLSQLSGLLPALVQGSRDRTTASGSITYFWYAYRLALEWTSREFFIPGSGENESDIGRWTALCPPDERERVNKLLQAMPGICRAFVDPPVPADRILMTFLDSCINTVVQDACRHHPVDLRGRARSSSNPVTRLLFQLFGTSPPGGDGEGDFPDEIIRPFREWLFDLTRGEKNPPFYTCIRLREPSGTSDAFSLEFLIQASDDPSLLVPAGQVWKKRSGSFTYLHHRFENPQEQLLADLFRAGKVFPPVREALRARAPSGLDLDPEMVFPFLTEAVPLLRQSGISVLLPAWWKDQSKKPRIALSVTPGKKQGKSGSRSGIFTMEALLSFQWNVKVGDVTLSPEEFDRLVEMKRPLVHLGGKWAVFNLQDLKHAVETFKKQYKDGKISAMDALRLGLGGEGPGSVPVDIVPSEGGDMPFFSPLLGKDGAASIRETPVPAGFSGELRPYQKKGLSWLSFMSGLGLGACLADDMGLGKTVQFIAYLLEGQKNGDLKHNLLICPMSLIGNWQRELARFAPGVSVCIHHGPARAEGEAFLQAVSKHDLILSTYQVVTRDQELMTRVSWDLVVLDEAQNIKNTQTRQTKAVRALTSSRRIALTGTPVENRLSELWSIMEFLNTGFLGNEKAFDREFGIPIEKYHDKAATEKLQRLVQPFILRRLKTDTSIIADLPEKNVMKRYCTLTPEQATLYKAIVDGLITEVKDIEGFARRAIILTAMVRLKQICDHPNAFLDDGLLVPDRSGKIGMLFSLLEEVLAAGDAAILFTQFSTFGGRLAELIRNTFQEEVLFLHGKTPRAARDEMVMRFMKPGGPRLFLLSLKAGGVGLNLTRASHVFHIDRWWNPAVEDQATDRAYRIGQKKNVSVHLLISAGTLEERIDQMIEEKRRLAGSIIGTGEDWILSLTTDELRDVFTLRGELIGGA